MSNISQWANSMSDADLQEVYDLALGFADGMVEKYGAMEVAAIMMTIALGIYKTGMSSEDYNNLVDVISASRDHVKTFEPRSLQ